MCVWDCFRGIYCHKSVLVVAGPAACRKKRKKKKEFGMPDLGQEGQVGFVCSGKQPWRLRAACCERITDAKILLVILKLLRTGFRAAEGIHQKGLAEHGGALRPAGPPQSPEEGENLGRQPSRLGVRVLLRAPLLRQHNSSYCCCRLSCSCLMTAEGKEKEVPGSTSSACSRGERRSFSRCWAHPGVPRAPLLGLFP